MKNTLKELWRDLTMPMKITYLVMLFIASAVLFGCSYFSWYPHDNLVEEATEYLIEERFGVDIDLTPSSPENK